MELTPEILKKHRLKKGFSQQQVADAIGTTQKSYQYYETGERNPKHDKVLKLIEVLEINDRTNVTIEKHHVPYYPDVNASAGLNFLTDNTNHSHIFISVPNIDAEAYINVFGDSMEPKYNGGEIIGIKEVSKDFLIFGYAYVVLMKDGAAYIKYVQPGHDKNHWVLDNENKHYKPNEFHLSKIAKVFIIKGKINKTTL